MQEQRGMFVERLFDAGQCYEPGIRVDFFPTERDPRKLTLEKAALGSFEVLGCDRVTAERCR